MNTNTISLIGLPGAGKTTLCRSLAVRLGWRDFILGDALRARATKDSTLRELLDRGKLAPESVAIELVQEAAHETVGRGLVLDGFPRHVDQVSLSIRLFTPSWFILYLDIDVSTAIGRLNGRFSCAACGWVGTGSYEPNEVCPNCGQQELRKRMEDQSGIAEARLREANERLHELLLHMSDLRVHRLDASLPVDQVLENAIACLATNNS